MHPASNFGDADFWDMRRFPSSALRLYEVDSILSEAALAPPHGLGVLIPIPVPEMPKLPTMPDKKDMHPAEAWYIEQYEELRTTIEVTSKANDQKMCQEQVRGAEVAAACKKGDPAAIRTLILTILKRHPLPQPMALEADFALDRIARVALCTIQVPDFAKLSIVNKRGRSIHIKWLPVSETQRKRSSEPILHSLCIRAAYLVAMGDPGGFFHTVAVNAHQKWFDPATGAPREGIIASLQATKDELCQLRPPFVPM